MNRYTLINFDFKHTKKRKHNVYYGLFVAEWKLIIKSCLIFVSKINDNLQPNALK